MSASIFEEAASEFLSIWPEGFVTHLTNAQRELLLGVKNCVGECVDEAVQTLDACVELSKQKRARRAEARAGERVDIEEEGDEDEGEEDADGETAETVA